MGSQGIGSLMLDLTDKELSEEERDMLEHPAVGGVIFFTRNYESPEQLERLVETVREASPQPLLVAVDHEGGRVQRFREEFTPLPAIGRLGGQYDDDPLAAKQQAERLGWLMAAEVRAMDIDFSFAPVLDLDYGVSEVIGDRSFHRQPAIVSELASAYITGMRQAGMAATGKHFPGHGWVKADSHLAIPRDDRDRAAIMREDIVPFTQLFAQGLEAVMPAHVIYEQVDEHPAGFSTVWLQTILRKQLHFDGVIFSDDLTMEAATVAGGFSARAEAALAAGCDMVLVCNHRAGAIEVLEQVNFGERMASQTRLERMRGRPFMNRSALLDEAVWRDVAEQATAMV